MSWSEAKWVVDQLLQKTGQMPNNMRAFTVYATSKNSLGLKFLEPADSYDSAGNLLCSVGGVMIRKMKDRYPATTAEGDLVINNTELGAYQNTELAVTGLEEGVNYYFSAFPYSAQGVFNLSPNAVNRAECAPADGEHAVVTITIDDDSGFTIAQITCVDETDSESTQTINLTPSKLSHTFTVPIGHTYHIEYGDVTGYFKPSKTTSKVSVAGATSNYTGAYSYFTSTINVTYPAGSTCTCSNGTTTYTASDTSGSVAFSVHSAGTWTVRCTSGSLSSQSSVTISDTGETKSVTLAYFTANIAVTYPAGSTLTCTKGSEVLTASTTTGSYTFNVHSAGNWVVRCTDGTEEATQTVNITTDGQSESVTLAYVKIYGISRTVANSSTAWSRTDDAVGKTATASVGTTAGASDFDDCYPWSAMERETLSTSDVMVKIPEFWYKRYIESGVEYIKIADKSVDGYTKHPGSNRYVGAYKTSSNNRSVTGTAPTVSQTRATMRTNAKSKGTGWGIIDLATWSAIMMLYLVEFADNNSQSKVGRGYCDNNSAALSSGGCNSVPNLTGRPAGTDGKTDVVYRGIEGIWGNIWEWVDGINYNGDADNYYVCADPTKYADDTATNYTRLSYTSPSANAYITKEGLDTSLPWAMLPSEASGGSETTYYPDYFYQNSGWRVCKRSGYWSDGSYCGVFYCDVYSTSSSTSAYIGSRLLYVPS